ncbi:hypothetical protein BDF21DRAFT_431939 [Thamnidium elegans]|uniref:Uncharacterized protein n=1 Tax=Thamnidium elegans TaxID=101142 RepID=A0A8H7VTH5_9FUNG|nr:hypothetical protein INT48_008738 [Thamnidium elegans]KAI8052783.1 hypothetical protein BDF21DRAFT_431939 [Thamnidium elegans]
MTLNCNLPMIYKKTETSVIERTKQETAVVEHAMTEDDLTHPALYRYKMNSLPGCNYRKYHANQNPQQNNNSSRDSNWDLYPGLIRNIENEGTPEQVDKLHHMEQSL